MLTGLRECDNLCCDMSCGRPLCQVQDLANVLKRERHIADRSRIKRPTSKIRTDRLGFARLNSRRWERTFMALSPQQQATQREIRSPQYRDNGGSSITHLQAVARWRAVAQVTRGHYRKNESEGFRKHRA